MKSKNQKGNTEMDPSRPLPHNEHSESYAVGILMIRDNAESELIARGFTPEWLFLPRFATLWRVLSNFRSKHQPAGEINAVTLLSELLATSPNTLAEMGGPVALSNALDMSMCSMEPTHLDHHVSVLKACFLRRQAIQTATRLEAAAYASDDIDATLADTINSLGSLAAGTVATRIKNGSDVLNAFLTDLETVSAGGTTSDAPSYKSGISEIDDIMGGIIPDFWLIGADTSGGKTALSLQFVRSVINQGGRVLVFALEMSDRQLVRRIVAGEGRIPMQRLLRPETLIEYDFVNLSGRGATWAAENLLICDDGDVTIQEVRAIARSEHARDPLAMVVVDYIQLASAGKFKDGANREQEVSFIAAQCKKMSKELGVPVIAPTQLNDNGQVRESRALKQHAAVYLVIEPERILCAKGRDVGRDWSIPYKLTGDIQTFEPHHNPR